MPNLWISESLTTQDWVSNRGAFLFQSALAHLSEYWANESREQLQYGQILYSITEELAILDAYNNWVRDQGDPNNIDPLFAHISEAPLFRTNVTMPRPTWYDGDYRTFLMMLGKIYLQGSTLETIRQCFLAYCDATRGQVKSIRVDEVWKYHAVDTPYNIVDQHTADIHIPPGLNITQTSEDIYSLFETIRPAHVFLRLIADPVGKGEFIHGATISDAFYLKLYIIEERPPVVLLSWAEGETPPTWFDDSPQPLLQYNVFGPLSSRSLYDDQIQGFTFLSIGTHQLFEKRSGKHGDWKDPIPFGSAMIPMAAADLHFAPGPTGPFTDVTDIPWYVNTLTDTVDMINQLRSGVFAPGIAPTFRYRSTDYEFIIM